METDAAFAGATAVVVLNPVTLKNLNCSIIHSYRNTEMILPNGVAQKLAGTILKANELGDAIKFCLTGQRSALPYVQLAERLSVSEASLKVMVHRLRKRYRELLQQEIAHTVAEPGAVDEELRYLFEVLSQ